MTTGHVFRPLYLRPCPRSSQLAPLPTPWLWEMSLALALWIKRHTVLVISQGNNIRTYHWLISSHLAVPTSAHQPLVVAHLSSASCTHSVLLTKSTTPHLAHGLMLSSVRPRLHPENISTLSCRTTTLTLGCLPCHLVVDMWQSPRLTMPSGLRVTLPSPYLSLRTLCHGKGEGGCSQEGPGHPGHM